MARARSAARIELRKRRFRNRAVEELRSEIKLLAARSFDAVATSAELSGSDGELPFMSLVDGRDIISACSVSDA